MNEEKPNIQYATKKSPIFSGMPDYLKDHKNYEKIQRVLLEELATGHSHGEVVEWASCVDCQSKFRNKGEMIKKLGFSSVAQYKAWQLVHSRIDSMLRSPLQPKILKL